MAKLSDFSPDEIELLVSIPYKAGVWISNAEDEEGEADDVREMKALEVCIRAVAKVHEDKPFIKEVAAETLKRRNQWPDWQENCFAVTREASKATALLGSKSSGAQKNYRGMVMEIASAVAMAYGEFGQFDDEEGFFNKIVSKFKSMSHDEAGHPMNVSAGESEALAQLAAALKPGN